MQHLSPSFPAVLSKKLFRFLFVDVAAPRCVSRAGGTATVAGIKRSRHTLYRCFLPEAAPGSQAGRVAPSKIIEAIRVSPELQDLAQRPLLLLMILQIFASAGNLDEKQWSITKLYRRYSERWLKHEASKPDSVLKWNEKVVDITRSSLVYLPGEMRLSIFSE